MGITVSRSCLFVLILYIEIKSLSTQELQNRKVCVIIATSAKTDSQDLKNGEKAGRLCHAPEKEVVAMKYILKAITIVIVIIVLISALTIEVR